MAGPSAPSAGQSLPAAPPPPASAPPPPPTAQAPGPSVRRATDHQDCAVAACRHRIVNSAARELFTLAPIRFVALDVASPPLPATKSGSSSQLPDLLPLLHNPLGDDVGVARRILAVQPQRRGRPATA